MSGENYVMEWMPTLWQRLVLWNGWPWIPRTIPWSERTIGTQPFVAVVRVNDYTVGWNPIDSAECTTVVVLDWWACFAGLFRRPRIEVSVMRDS